MNQRTSVERLRVEAADANAGSILVVHQACQVEVDALHLGDFAEESLLAARGVVPSDADSQACDRNVAVIDELRNLVLCERDSHNSS